jgi:hypothetical protein
LGSYFCQTVWACEVGLVVVQTQVYGFQRFFERFTAGWVLTRVVQAGDCDFFLFGDDESLVKYERKPCL